jgi:geranylgeranyl diphosphate synthase type I
MRTEVAAGQYLDLLSQISHSTSVRAALRVVTYKTAKYTIERPLQLGAALAVGAQTGAIPGGRSTRARAGIPKETRAARTATDIEAVCTEYGIPLGIAFQLRDDVLGVFGDPARTGKPVSGDISEGKRTVLMAIARERASKSQARVLDRHLGDRNLTEAAAARVKAVLIETGAVAECEALIGASVKEAVAALDGAPIAADAKAALAALAVTATDRAE